MKINKKAIHNILILLGAKTLFAICNLIILLEKILVPRFSNLGLARVCVSHPVGQAIFDRDKVWDKTGQAPVEWPWPFVLMGQNTGQRGTSLCPVGHSLRMSTRQGHGLKNEGKKHDQ